MTTPAEIQAAARAPYGPAAGRPSATSMGDKALWVDPGASHTLYQVQSGNWVKIGVGTAPPAAPAGVPILYGPYVVDYTDIPHDGDTMTLWTPAVGDVVLRLFPDWRTWVQWDHGSLAIGQDMNTDGPAYNFWFSPSAGNLGGLDLLFAGSVYNNSATNTSAYAIPIISADPVQIKLSQTSGTDPTQGHVALFALIARAIAP